ncbi:MAG: DUF664 domain-containing protein [Thermaceae bacterium]|nr:DUF664 domain-containing protein [Thermaceae bacterium]
MSASNLFLVKPKTGFSPRIGELVSMMNYARFTTLQAVQGLTPPQLDYLLDEDSNSIGALLYHFAAVESWYQTYTFEGREMSPEEEQPWWPGFEMGPSALRELGGKPLEFYLELLEAVRAKTLEEFAGRDDDWLYQEFPLWNATGNNYFCWFHVLEDEINHRGQIRLIRKRLPK